MLLFVKLPQHTQKCVVHAQDFKGADVRFGDVSSKESLRKVAFNEPVDVVVSCLASRTGGKVCQQRRKCTQSCWSSNAGILVPTGDVEQQFTVEMTAWDCQNKF